MTQSKSELPSLEGRTPAQERTHAALILATLSVVLEPAALASAGTGSDTQSLSPTQSAAPDLHFHRVPTPESLRAPAESHAAGVGAAIFQFLV